MQMHLVYFSRRTLPEMLRREGFHIADVAPTDGRVRVSYLVCRLGAYNRPRTPRSGGADAREPDSTTASSA